MKIFLILVLLFCVGCDWLVPETVKAKIERKQYQELKEQNKYYERIAAALEKIAGVR